MKTFHFTTSTLLLMVVLLGACQSAGPKQAFDQLAEAAERGDKAAFLSGLTKPSRDVLDGILAFQNDYSTALSTGPFGTTTRAVAVEIRDAMAMVQVKTDSDPPQIAQVVMALEDGRWRLDLLATEWVWGQNWELSGGKPRTSLFQSPADSATESGLMNGQPSSRPLP